MIRADNRCLGQLGRLCLLGKCGNDSTLADLLKVLGERGRSQGLVDVNMRRTEFGPLAFRALIVHHAMTLVRLNLTQCPNSTCQMCQLILCSCPNLLSFSGRGLLASNIMIFQHIPWVCTHLEVFEFSIHMDLFDPFDQELAHQHIFERLSGLTRLQRLDLLGDIVGPPPSIMGGQTPLEHLLYPTLSMRLSLGLGQLRTLQGLAHLLFDGYDVNMSMADWRFILKELPLSCTVKSSVHPTILRDPELSRLAKAEYTVVVKKKK